MTSLFFALCTLFVSSSKVVRLNDFSEIYYAEVEVFDTTDYEYATQLTLYTKKNSKSVFTTEVMLSRFDFENGQITTNVQELPYGEQSVLIYEDFNFDGVKDLALRTSYGSCYGGPAYSIFLADENDFSYSASFSDLGQSYCGMFGVDVETKQLSTMTKSGCCWHQYSLYDVVDNQPRTIEIIEEGISTNGIFMEVSHETLKNGKMVATDTRFLLREIQTPFFELTFNNGKKLALINFDDSELIYVFMKENDEVELDFSQRFIYDKNTQMLSFTNNKTTYDISKNGVVIKTNSQIYNLNKVSKTSGAITNAPMDSFKNVASK